MTGVNRWESNLIETNATMSLLTSKQGDSTVNMFSGVCCGLAIQSIVAACSARLDPITSDW